MINLPATKFSCAQRALPLMVFLISFFFFQIWDSEHFTIWDNRIAIVTE